MKRTLLDMTQSILSDMGDDEVTDISDTIRSLQVVNIIKDTYYWLISTRDWPHLQNLYSLTPSNDITLPTHMSMIEGVKEIGRIKYNKRTATDTKDKWEEVHYLHRDDFLDEVNGYDTSLTTVTTVTDPSGVALQIKTDKAPTYWTSFDDDYIVFNSYNSAVDDTLQEGKTQVMAEILPSWTNDNQFIPDLPATAFPGLLAEAKSQCFLSLKQMSNQKEEQKSQVSRNWLRQKSARSRNLIRFQTGGRVPRK